MTHHAERLERLATLALRVGVNLQPGQNLILVGPPAAQPLIHAITRAAYALGAPLVSVDYHDERINLLRVRHADPATLETVDADKIAMIHAKLTRGDAYLRIVGSDPDLMSAADPTRLARMLRASSAANRPVGDLVQRSHMPWTIIPAATPEWAAKVFPDASPAEALERLWDALFAATRADTPDTLARWETHLAALAAVRDHLNDRDYAALHLRAPGTELRIGLAERHAWIAGGSTAVVNGATHVANLPTEEVFTAPHAQRVDGTVRSTKPLSYQGQLIEDFTLRFEAGRVTHAHAQRGDAALQALLAVDEGSRRLGELALVPQASPINRSGLLFYNTLLDENATCHLALGRAYETALRDAAGSPRDELARRGFNDSLVHVDFMFGSDALDIDGERHDGSRESVMRAGAWAYGG
jgi:aminopeptidase